MENKVFKANLEGISKRNKNLAQRISVINSLIQNIEIFQNENGEYNISVNGVSLHSKDGAELEAKNIVQKIENIENENSAFVIFGLEFAGKNASSQVEIALTPHFAQVIITS